MPRSKRIETSLPPLSVHRSVRLACIERIESGLELALLRQAVSLSRENRSRVESGLKLLLRCFASHGSRVCMKAMPERIELLCWWMH